MPLPPVPDSFYWADAPWGVALRCRALDELAPHLFTTRQLAVTGHRGQGQLAAALGVERVASLRQVHGAAVEIIRDGAAPPLDPPEADALVSNALAVAIAVRAADCVPLLMADSESGAVAAVHAGWRGTAARVATAALKVMQREFGTQPQRIVAAIGPSIGPCCYAVGPDLVDAFAAAGHERYLIDRWFSTPSPAEGFGGASRGVPGAGRWPQLRLDVAGANRDQLILAGVPEGHIHDSRLCTAMHLDVLTSYRAEKEHASRIAGAIAAGRR
jgi:YfiH family protein